VNLLNLAARVCRVFSTSSSKELQTVQKVKDSQRRDVVTELDMKLHKISEEFVIQRLPGCQMLSEEGYHSQFQFRDCLKSEWLIVDPLDGSNNHALGLPNYGYMAALLKAGKIKGSVIVLPEHDQYIVLQDEQTVYSQPVALSEANEFGTVYYAYPPKQDQPAREARSALLDLIDSNSAGMYRYGSACAGLFQLLCGRHIAFIGHGIRIWDAIAFLPVLSARKITTMYAIRGEEFTLLASTQTDFVKCAAQILEQKQGLSLHYYRDDELKVDSP
jgi:myo-inositol-1(or 4)-monophosphatase